MLKCEARRLGDLIRISDLHHRGGASSQHVVKAAEDYIAVAKFPGPHEKCECGRCRCEHREGYGGCEETACARYSWVPQPTMRNR